MVDISVKASAIIIIRQLQKSADCIYI